MRNTLILVVGLLSLVACSNQRSDSSYEGAASPAPAPDPGVESFTVGPSGAALGIASYERFQTQDSTRIEALDARGGVLVAVTQFPGDRHTEIGWTSGATTWRAVLGTDTGLYRDGVALDPKAMSDREAQAIEETVSVIVLYADAIYKEMGVGASFHAKGVEDVVTVCDGGITVGQAACIGECTNAGCGCTATSSCLFGDFGCECVCCCDSNPC